MQFQFQKLLTDNFVSNGLQQKKDEASIGAVNLNNRCIYIFYNEYAKIDSFRLKKKTKQDFLGKKEVKIKFQKNMLIYFMNISSPPCITVPFEIGINYGKTAEQSGFNGLT